MSKREKRSKMRDKMKLPPDRVIWNCKKSGTSWGIDSVPGGGGSPPFYVALFPLPFCLSNKIYGNDLKLYILLTLHPFFSLLLSLLPSLLLFKGLMIPSAKVAATTSEDEFTATTVAIDADEQDMESPSLLLPLWSRQPLVLVVLHLTGVPPK